MQTMYHHHGAPNTITKVSTTGSPTLSPQDRCTLEVGSAIAADVIAARGVFSVERGRDLPPEFSRRQRGRGAGILFRVWRPDGSTAWMFRPREADPDRPGLKYEAGCKSRGAPGNTLDVHPSCREWIEDKTVPVVFVEGIKKADAIISAARNKARERIVVVAISGVWNWLSGGEPIPDMFLIPIEGREVRVCFDSDVFCNPDVADAARRLAEHIRGRGAASVLLAYLPQAEPERKVGADDYLAAGHSYADLAGCFKPFDPGDLAAERLRRSDLLRARLEDTWRTFWDTEWRGMGGHSARDLYKVLCDLAGDRGRLHPDGLRVKASRRELIELVRVSSRTLQKAIERLEDKGLVYRDNPAGRKAESRGAFVLVTNAPSTQSDNVNHEGQGTDTEQKQSKSLQCLYAGGLHRRFAPTARRLRWSTPGRRARRGTVPGTRRVRDNITPAREAVKRFGKNRGALIDALEAFGGFATFAELGEAIHLAHPRELVRFRRSAKGKDGGAVMLMEAGLVEWVSDVAARREGLRLADDWAERLAEIDDLESDRLRRREWHDRDRDDFRKYRERQHRAAAKRSRRKAEPRKSSASEPARPERAHPADGYISDPDPALLAALAEFLRLRPGAVAEGPSWLAVALWASDHVEGKPTPEAVEVALAALRDQRAA
ncbi:MAG: DUF3854 domain-containing protein [Actinomycetota bacterium]|nr:DUF3854 domain-containing protein [Actinomycetota bacterium]